MLFFSAVRGEPSTAAPFGTPAATVFAFCGVREESSALRFTKSTAEALETVLVGRGGTGGFFFLARAFSSASERSLSSGGGAHAVKMRPGGPDGLGQAKLAGAVTTVARGVELGVVGFERSAAMIDPIPGYLLGFFTAAASAAAALAAARSLLSVCSALIRSRLSLL